MGRSELWHEPGLRNRVTPGRLPSPPGSRRLPGEVAGFCGPGAAIRLEEFVHCWEGRRVFIVHGRRSLRASTAHRIVDRLRRSGTCEVILFAGVSPNPDVGQVRAATDAIRRYAPDVVVGIGGGSVLDVAKASAFLSAQAADPLQVLWNPPAAFVPRRCRLVLVPTTSGSGSEMTRFATVYVDRRKQSFDHELLLADVALVDASLTASLSTPQAVACGLDALAHAVESYWAVGASAGSRAVAAEAIGNVAAPLRRALAAGTFADPGLRADLAWGASLAGTAIDRTRTTAAHALSYPLTARLRLPHGVAVALHLRWLVGHNARVTAANCRHPDGASGVRRLIGAVEDKVEAETGAPLAEFVTELLAFGGYPSRLSRLVLPPSGPLALLDGVLGSRRATNNPRVVTEADVLRAFQGGHA